MTDGPRRTRVCRDRDNGLFGDDVRYRVDVLELTGPGIVLRLVLPYAAVVLCLAVTAWLAFAHLL